ncbi:MAG: hypothetical protein R3D89_07525 [Sphingomonadaceae bacterium]
MGYVFSNNHEAEHNEVRLNTTKLRRGRFFVCGRERFLITSGNSDAEVATFNDPSSSSLPFGDGYDRFHIGKFRGRPAPLRLSEDQKYYVTRMKDAYRQPVNFGGSLVLLQFGCGLVHLLTHWISRAVLYSIFQGGGISGMQLHAQDDECHWLLVHRCGLKLFGQAFAWCKALIESPVIKIDCASTDQWRASSG